MTKHIAQNYVKYLTAAGLLFLLLLGYFRPITALTQDLGRHIKTGQLILATHTVPKINLYSYTYPSFPFINHHWGSEVVFALLYQTAGFQGLFVLMLTLVTAAFSLQIKSVFAKASSLALGIAGFLYLGVLFERIDLRPELFSFFLLSLFIFILYKNREKPTRLIYLLIPLQLLWVNLHIYFAVGLVVIGLFLIDAVITYRKKLVSPPVYTLAAVLGCCVVAALINPNGITGFLYPLRVFQNYGYTIEENQTVFLLMNLGFQKPTFPFFFTAVVLLFTNLAVTYKKTRPIDWLLSVVFTYLAFSAVRNFPLFVFTTFIPFTLALTATLQRLSSLFPKAYRLYATVLLIIGLLLWQGLQILNKGPLGYGVTQGAEKAIEFLARENLPGPIFNNFDIGSFLIYKGYPERKVFVDGRPEAYPADFFTNLYIPMQQDPAVFATAEKQYGFNTIFFSHTDQTPWGNTFLTRIVSDPTWTIVYLDDYVIILMKKTPEHEATSKRLGMTREKLRVSNIENTFEAKLRLVSFFTKIGWDEHAVPYAEAMLKEKPNFCPAIGLLAQMYSAQNHPAAMIYSQRYTANCI